MPDASLLPPIGREQEQEPNDDEDISNFTEFPGFLSESYLPTIGEHKPASRFDAGSVYAQYSYDLSQGDGSRNSNGNGNSTDGDGDDAASYDDDEDGSEWLSQEGAGGGLESLGSSSIGDYVSVSLSLSQGPGTSIGDQRRDLTEISDDDQDDYGYDYNYNDSTSKAGRRSNASSSMSTSDAFSAMALDSRPGADVDAVSAVPHDVSGSGSGRKGTSSSSATMLKSPSASGSASILDSSQSAARTTSSKIGRRWNASSSMSDRFSTRTLDSRPDAVPAVPHDISGSDRKGTISSSTTMSSSQHTSGAIRETIGRSTSAPTGSGTKALASWSSSSSSSSPASGRTPNNAAAPDSSKSTIQDISTIQDASSSERKPTTSSSSNSSKPTTPSVHRYQPGSEVPSVSHSSGPTPSSNLVSSPYKQPFRILEDIEEYSAAEGRSSEGVDDLNASADDATKGSGSPLSQQQQIQQQKQQASDFSSVKETQMTVGFLERIIENIICYIETTNPQAKQSSGQSTPRYPSSEREDRSFCETQHQQANADCWILLVGEQRPIGTFESKITANNEQCYFET
eukprot:jgi/Psemu1/283001/fgenesh1_pg.18_\